MAFDNISTSKTGTQRLYTGRSPLDAKALVATYNQLLDPATWTEESSIIAYNGMITAVWLNTEDSSKNGIYFLYDSTVTSKFKAPDVSKAENWHKLADIDDLAYKLSLIDDRITVLEEKESDVVTYGYRSGFPATGEANKLYIAADEGKSYVWFNDDYIPVSGVGDYEEPEVIYGGDSGVDN